MRHRRLLLPSVALCVGMAALVGLASAPVGARAGLWDFSTGFQLLRWAVYLGLTAAALGALGMLVALAGERRGGGTAFALASVALLAGLVAAAVPLRQYRIAKTVPPINDITTDLERPPDFAAAGRGEENGAAGVLHPGAEFADQQRRAYPDLKTLTFEASAERAFEAALATARSMSGWRVVFQEPSQGRIEATATTRWFRFLDDVVIRVSPRDGGSEVDMRSRSRVGRSDVGANAARIRAFARELAKRLESSAG